jgi:hypothetical protein
MEEKKRMKLTDKQRRAMFAKMHRGVRTQKLDACQSCGSPNVCSRSSSTKELDRPLCHKCRTRIEYHIKQEHKGVDGIMRGSKTGVCANCGVETQGGTHYSRFFRGKEVCLPCYWRFSNERRDTHKLTPPNPSKHLTYEDAKAITEEGKKPIDVDVSNYPKYHKEVIRGKELRLHSTNRNGHDYYSLVGGDGKTALITRGDIRRFLKDVEGRTPWDVEDTMKQLNSEKKLTLGREMERENIFIEDNETQ